MIFVVLKMLKFVLDALKSLEVCFYSLPSQNLKTNR
jgi:hypothetical protein